MITKKQNFLIILVVLSIIACSPKQNNYETDTSNWFQFNPGEDFVSESEFNLGDWLDAPAGKYGWLQYDEKGDFVFENGTPIKFWGTNICSDRPYIEKEEVDRFVDLFTYYGLNGIRFHKFTKHGLTGTSSTLIDPEKFARFDYYQHRLKESGIYYGWSHIYGHKVLPGDSARIENYSEIKNLNYPWSHLNGSTASLVNFAPDLQDLSIELTVNMLNHVNPHTGLRYAEDPALAFIEFQNEDNIFWGAIQSALEQAPAYRAMLCKQFSLWLKEKYKNQDALVEAWGANNIPEGESLSKLNIFPNPDHSLFSWEYDESLKTGKPMARHTLEKMRFLYETQVKFYKRFEAAIRETGYQGVLVGSCWQAGSGFSHFYNLHADYEVGIIDRHNYFGGGSGHQLKPTKVKHLPMLDKPGSGLLSLGMQQVVDRPFAISEWMSLVPNEWTAEAAPIIAIYGLGLQGWDASFSFATDISRFSRLVESEWHGVYNATSPLHLGLYPALTPLVYRQDVKESPLLNTRNVHIPSFIDGVLDFEEKVTQDFDVKSFTGSVPSEALAIGKYPIQFTEEYEETTLPDLSSHWDTLQQVISSVTGELEWHYGEHDYLTVNTASTKGIVGFTNEQEIELGDWTLKTSNPFAVVFVTSLSKEKDLDSAERILITTVARARNTGMIYNEAGDSLIATGDIPLLLEPVNLEIENKTLNGASISVLDHAGRKTESEIDISNTSVFLDGQKHKTMYYLIKKPIKADD